nr:DUF5682 family protein [Microvenator marinus]
MTLDVDHILQNREGIHFFPVRHSSPAAARMLRLYARQIQPSVILIEGPSEFNPSLDELYLAHELPIAIYTYVRFENASRASAFYPLAEFSPEWQALKAAQELGVKARFIDLPWVDLSQITNESHRYSDRHFLKNPYPERLAQELGVQGFDEVWDVLFELDPDLNTESYLRRAHTFCLHLRLSSGDESTENRAREEFMVREIQEARARLDGPILVVTGGFHSSGLYSRLFDVELNSLDLERVEIFSPDIPDEPEEPEEPEEEPSAAPDLSVEYSGATLTPFTYKRIDAISGYQSGVQGPGFYEYVFRTRNEGKTIDSLEILQSIVSRLRDKQQILNTADLIAVQNFAQAMAGLHSRKEVWRFDLMDAIEATLVKDSSLLHPVVAEARHVLTGSRRGTIAKGASLPLLFTNTLKELEEKGLGLAEEPAHIELNLEFAEDRARSHTLHRLRELEIRGVDFEGGTDFYSREDLSEIWESWTLKWIPEFDGTLIEAAIWGADLSEASAAHLTSRAAKPNLSASGFTELVVDATLMGVRDLAGDLLARVGQRLSAETDVFELGHGLSHLVFLTRHAELLGTADPSQTLTLVRAAFLRTLALLDNLGFVQDRDNDQMRLFETLHSTAVQWFKEERPWDLFAETLGRIAFDTSKRPLTRGLALGSLFREDLVQAEAIRQALDSFLDPMELADFLVGLFFMARIAVQRDPNFILTLDLVVSEANELSFLEMLPGLRLAFTFFSPNEKHQIVDTLFRDEAEESGEDASALEAWLVRVAADFGIPLEPPGMIAAKKPAQPKSLIRRPEVDEDVRKSRWRLILGDDSGASGFGLSAENSRRALLLDYLYRRELGPRRNIRAKNKKGGSEASELTVPEWINGVHELFPKRTIERLEKDAIDRYQIEEIVTRPEILNRATPNLTLLKAVLRTKHLMNQEVLHAAKRIVEEVVRELMEKLAREIQTPFLGALNRKRRSALKIAKNFDAAQTIRRNLKHWDPESQKLIVQNPIFFTRIRRHAEKWRLIIVVDQSGSMLENVIHAAVSASIFHKLNQLKSNLVAFDTQVVDLSESVSDPVETLLNVQLGGGTDIANALEYASKLVDDPNRTIVVLITDFFEGGPVEHLFAMAKGLVEQGTHVLGLAALDGQAEPHFDREIAQRLANLGVHIGAMTPGELAQWVAEKIR